MAWKYRTPKHFQNGDSEYGCETLTHYWFPWLGGGVENCMTSKHQTYPNTSQRFGGHFKYHSKKLIKTFRISLIYFKDVHMLNSYTQVILIHRNKEVTNIFTLSHIPHYNILSPLLLTTKTNRDQCITTIILVFCMGNGGSIFCSHNILNPSA
jgi:hypothetical protein